MEVVAGIVSSAVVETGRFVFGSYPNINNFIRFHSILKDLEKEMKSLLDLKNKVKEKADSADNQIRDWLKEAEKFVLQVNSVQADAGNMEANNGKLCGCFFNFRGRYNLSKEMARLLKEVERLLKAGDITAKMMAVNCLPMVEHLPGPSIGYQTTASQNLAKLMGLLKDNDVRLIGVWGMGGVGKTTLVQNLNNKLKHDSSSSTQQFSIVIWATVSKDSVLKNVQMEIARRLDLKVVEAEENEHSLAKRLYQRLQNEKKFLLILDDVWKPIDLNSLGVPEHAGSKIILTSRFLNVCTQMDAKPMKVVVLNGKEAWELFCKVVNNGANFEQDLESTAREVARECSGLPLAIKIVGAAMRGKTPIEWEDALKELQMSEPDLIEGVEDKVYKHLKWSYDLLQGKNIKPCFLYCSLYPEDYSIEVSELVWCWIGEGLIDIERLGYEASHNKGIALIESLKKSCMLELGTSENHVKMHDVVRDVAIWISSSEECGWKSLVWTGHEISQVEMSRSFKRVSFMNTIKRLPDRVIPCPHTSTLVVLDNLHLERIPDGFLAAFESLWVLKLGGTDIKSLPQSILQLHELRVLILRNCPSLSEISQVGGLWKLEMLDCSHSGITQLPIEMKNLSNLRELNLSYTRRLKIIAGGIISTLSHLEVLDMTHSAYVWVWKQEEAETSFEELGYLTRLRVLSLEFKSITITCLIYLCTDRLRSFRFHIGLNDSTGCWVRDGRTVTITYGDFSDKPCASSTILPLPREGIDVVFNIANSVVLHGCIGLNQMFETLGKGRNNGFSTLKSLWISHSSIRFGPGGGGSRSTARDLLPNLEQLHLSRVYDLESISELAGHFGLMFQRLKFINVESCHELKSLLSFGSSIQALPNLRKVEVSNCENLVELFNYGSQEDYVLEPVVPELQKVKLMNLPKLSSVCRSHNESWESSLEEVEVVGCPLVRKLPLNT